MTDLLVLRKQASNPLPYAPGTPLQGEPEDCVGPPASILLVVDHIPDCTVHIYSGHTLPQPLTLHLLGGDSPHLYMAFWQNNEELSRENGGVAEGWFSGGKLALG